MSWNIKLDQVNLAIICFFFLNNKIHFRTSESNTLASDTLPFPEADWASLPCLNADVTQRSEQAEPSGQHSYFENIPDMITVSGTEPAPPCSV